MTTSLDFLNATSEIIENDFVIVNLATEEITWKVGMFNPKMQNNILYWLKQRKEGV
jgi:hypothetical protein